MQITVTVVCEERFAVENQEKQQSEGFSVSKYNVVYWTRGVFWFLETQHQWNNGKKSHSRFTRASLALGNSLLSIPCWEYYFRIE